MLRHSFFSKGTGFQPARKQLRRVDSFKQAPSISSPSPLKRGRVGMRGEIVNFGSRFMGRANLSRKLSALYLLSVLALIAVWNAAGEPTAPDNTPATPRDFYNDGTQKLHAGKLREAEASLQAAVATQNEKVQTAALYNLGEVRFKQGAQELTNAPGGAAMEARSQHAQNTGTGALAAADEALAGDEVMALVAAYQRGRGAQKELKAATKAVQHAMETYRNVLLKWQRSSGDFKSTVELHPSDTDAQWNADLVDRDIARLVDTIQMSMQSLGAMGKQREELRDKMGKIKKRLPQGMGDEMKGGMGDDDDEDEDGKPKGPKPGEKEGPSRDGTEQQQLTPEEAERLLGMLKLDSGHKLPMGMGDTEAIKPVNRKGRDW
jgi:hypothetical protein